MARTGDRIGPYTLIRKVGRGGFGEVWLAEKKTRITTTEFAIKLAIDENPDIEAIRQEAELWKQASGHPNILPIIEADIYDDYIVVVSEFARGGSLEQWIAANQGAAPSTDIALEMISGILSGLEHLHGLHIIHRDLKPANILLQGNRPRLVDFGLARILKSGMYSETVAGTPDYMAPEAFLNERSERADLWAVGVMLYQLLTGSLPFPLNDRMSPWQKMAVITTQDVMALPPNMPPPLREVVIRSLQRKPDNRYGSAGEMLAALAEATDSLKYKAKNPPLPYPILAGATVKDAAPTVVDRPLLTTADPSGPPAPTVVDRPLLTTADPSRAPAPTAVEIASVLPLVTAAADHSQLAPVFPKHGLPKISQPGAAKPIQQVKPKKTSWGHWQGIVGVIAVAFVITAGLAVYISTSKKDSASVAEGPAETLSQPSAESGTVASHDAALASPGAAPASPVAALADVATYQLEMELSGGRTTLGAGLEPIDADQKYKLHFVPSEHGYLYIIAPGTQRDPTTYLTAKPIPATGVKTNEVDAGEHFAFPAGDHWMRVRGDLQTTSLTIVFSSEQLQSPEYLASAAGRKLSSSEYRELDSLAPKSAIAVEGDHCVVKAPKKATGEMPRPVVFDIRINRR
jgi:serine/threonine protein kinase